MTTFGRLLLCDIFLFLERGQDERIISLEASSNESERRREKKENRRRFPPHLSCGGKNGLLAEGAGFLAPVAAAGAGLAVAVALASAAPPPDDDENGGGSAAARAPLLLLPPPFPPPPSPEFEASPGSGRFFRGFFF